MHVGEKVSMERIRSAAGWEKEWLASPHNREKAKQCVAHIDTNGEWVYGEYTQALRNAMEIVAQERLGSTKAYSTAQLLAAMESLLTRDEEEDFRFLEIVVKQGVELGQVMSRNDYNLPLEEVVMLQAESCLTHEMNRGQVIPEPVQPMEEIVARSVVPVREILPVIGIEEIPKDSRARLIQEICMSLVEFPEASGHNGTLEGMEEALLEWIKGYEEKAKEVSFDGRIAANKALRSRQKLVIVQLAMRDRDRIPVISQALERSRIASSIKSRPRRIERHAALVDNFQKRPPDSNNFFVIG